MKLIPHCLTADEQCSIRSLIKFGRTNVPLAYLVLYPYIYKIDAAPKYISRRTSYHGV